MAKEYADMKRGKPPADDPDKSPSMGTEEHNQKGGEHQTKHV
jgi:hypothetical protein